MSLKIAFAAVLVVIGTAILVLGDASPVRGAFSALGATAIISGVVIYRRNAVQRMPVWKMTLGVISLMLATSTGVIWAIHWLTRMNQ